MSAQLLLVPTPLDFGIESTASVDELLPLATLRAAAGLEHWVVENAKTARAVLKRIDAVQALALPLQSLQIIELPRPTKGSGNASPAILGPLLQPLRLLNHIINLTHCVYIYAVLNRSPLNVDVNVLSSFSF